MHDYRAVGDPSMCFFDNGFSNANKNKPLWSGQKRKKILNPVSCIAPSFMKRAIKEGAYNREDHSRIYCYTLQLSDRAELANRSQNKVCVPFIQVNDESFGENFDPSDLVSNDPDKKFLAKNVVRAIAHMICEESEPKIV